MAETFRKLNLICYMYKDKLCEDTAHCSQETAKRQFPRKVQYDLSKQTVSFWFLYSVTFKPRNIWVPIYSLETEFSL